MFLAPDGLIRFLRARDWNDSKAFEMFTKWVTWRLDFKAEQIDPASISSLLIKETIILHGSDRLGRFCIVIRPRFHRPSD
jgi:hypothetical protein